MPNLFDDYSDDERGILRLNEKPDRKYPRNRAKLLNRLFEINDEEIAGLMMEFLDEEAVENFNLDLQ